jgi:general secretion pathway protein D
MTTRYLTWRSLPRFLAIATLLLAGGTVAGNADAPGDGESNGAITLNLQEADIQALINTVAEATDRNFVIDPRVRGTVTVVTERPMNEDELYRVFLSILEVHGFATVPTGDIIKVVPDANARQFGSAGQPDAPADIVTTVIPVEDVPVSQLVPWVRGNWRGSKTTSWVS